MNPGLDPEVVSSLGYDYSVTCVASNAAWYNPNVRWSRGGSSARSDGGRMLWVVGWVCGRGFFGCEFVNNMQLGSCDGFFLGR